MALLVVVLPVVLLDFVAVQFLIVVLPSDSASLTFLAAEAPCLEKGLSVLVALSSTRSLEAGGSGGLKTIKGSARGIRSSADGGSGFTKATK